MSDGGSFGRQARTIFGRHKKVISLGLQGAWWPYIRVGEIESVRMCD